jgi:jumonji domain-containing protein 7
VRWSSITDPNIPGSLPENVEPFHVCLKPGETLYLPAGWWHYVQQGNEMTIAINWWYDMEIRGAHWVFLNLLRNEEGLHFVEDDMEPGPIMES